MTPSRKLLEQSPVTVMGHLEFKVPTCTNSKRGKSLSGVGNIQTHGERLKTYC